MAKIPNALMRAGVAVLSLVVAGCIGAMQSSPDNPTSAGGLTPNVEDKDAGLVGVAPGFDVGKHKVIVVEKFPVTDPDVKDEGDRRFAAKMEGTLRLQGAITRLGRGSQAARYFAGIYGAGRTRAQADMRFVEIPSERVLLVTADRRVASVGAFGGSDEEHLTESFDDMARDLAKFLVRLSKGEAPRK